jgi:hypothetical protein
LDWVAVWIGDPGGTQFTLEKVVVLLQSAAPL